MSDDSIRRLGRGTDDSIRRLGRLDDGSCCRDVRASGPEPEANSGITRADLERAVVKAAVDYVKLRDHQARSRFGLDTDHASLEGKTLNATVKLLEEFDAQEVN